MKNLVLFIPKFSGTAVFHTAAQAALGLQLQTSKTPTQATDILEEWDLRAVAQRVMLGPGPSASPSHSCCSCSRCVFAVSRKVSMAGCEQTPNLHNTCVFLRKDASPPSAVFAALPWGHLESSWVGEPHSAACSMLPAMPISSNIRLLMSNRYSIILQPSRQAAFTAMAIITTGTLHTKPTSLFLFAVIFKQILFYCIEGSVFVWYAFYLPEWVYSSQ